MGGDNDYVRPDVLLDAVQFIEHPREMCGFFAVLCRPQPAHEFRIVLPAAANALELNRDFAPDGPSEGGLPVNGLALPPARTATPQPCMALRAGAGGPHADR